LTVSATYNTLEKPSLVNRLSIPLHVIPIVKTLAICAAVALTSFLHPQTVIADDSVHFLLPADRDAHDCVTRASTWLNKHVVEGTIGGGPEFGKITLIAWHDPSLPSSDHESLTAYAITDSLWASRAMSLEYPSQSKAIIQSLEKLDCHRNNLHEVLFQPIPAIHHRSDDEDIVHGYLLGTFQVNNQTISVRSFRMRYDADCSIGHPSLFAEHAVYQALFHFWRGEKILARKYMESIFVKSPNPQAPIHWDRDRAILVDHVNFEDYRRFLARETQECRQYSFKLAAVIYAIRLMNIDVVEQEVLKQMQQCLWSTQLESGGIPHFFDVGPSYKITSCPDATGEATAITILSEVVMPSSP
jgi:hypothetical protein